MTGVCVERLCDNSENRRVIRKANRDCLQLLHANFSNRDHRPAATLVCCPNSARLFESSVVIDLSSSPSPLVILRAVTPRLGSTVRLRTCLLKDLSSVRLTAEPFTRRIKLGSVVSLCRERPQRLRNAAIRNRIQFCLGRTPVQLCPLWHPSIRVGDCLHG